MTCEHRSLALDTVLAILTGHRPIVVLAPHPDDEALGCGGLLAHAFATHGAHVVLMTDGTQSHPGSTAWPAEARASLRAAELEASVRELGGSPADITRLGLPDAGMTSSDTGIPALARQLSSLLSRLGARCLFATAPTDPHCDHQATAEIARQAARLSGARLFFYPIWSRWTDSDFRSGLPQTREVRLDTRDVRLIKARAIAAHQSQLGDIICDDPEGFTLDPAFVRLFLHGDELFFEEHPE